MANQQLNSGNPRIDIEYRRKKNAEEMKHQVVSFALMIFLTFIAFAAVAYEGLSLPGLQFHLLSYWLLFRWFFRYYYFMHMSHKGHESHNIYLYWNI